MTKGTHAMSLPLIIIGALLILDAVFALSIASPNLGTYGPAILGAPLLVYGLFYAKLNIICASGLPRVIRAAAVLCYCLVAVIMIVSSVLMAVAAGKRAPANADAVIVLGAGLRGSRLSLTMKNRLDAALDYADGDTDMLITVTGGKGRGEALPEAHAQQNYLLSAGVDESRIIVEDESMSTAENLENAKKLLDGTLPAGYRVAVVTSGFHLYRALDGAKKAGFTDCGGVAAHTPLYLLFNNVLRESAAIFRMIFE